MKQELSYRDSVHRLGRVWMLSALAMMIAVPSVICIYYSAWPSAGGILKGFLSVAPIFWTVGVIEVFTYVPMLGTGGSYLGFVTGNLANLKVPCALNSMDRAGVQAGTEEGEVISTLAIATSSIVTTVIIALGVLLLSQIEPILESPVLQPAFENILPALFGALGVVFVSKNWKIAIAPLVVMIALFLLVPSLASAVGLMVPVGALIAIGAARILYKRNLL
ncbi:MAG: hypothetical protein PHW41_05255 [Eubacteriales bacterium]|nr:hypothetical protein [Eubacteriales bacterium]